MHVIMTFLRRLRGDESGFAMATVVAGIGVATLLAVADRLGHQLERPDHGPQPRREAGLRGGAGRHRRLLLPPQRRQRVLGKCTGVPTPTAVNQMGSTTNRKPVPGTTGRLATAIELIPATGKSTCSAGDPSARMIEQSGTARGTFRIRSTGYSAGSPQLHGGECVADIVASYSAQLPRLRLLHAARDLRPGHLWLHDPAAIDGANSQCSKTRRQGRYDDPIPGTGGDYCDRILFATGEQINGPLHTNDALIICGSPTFGRTAADVIEVGAIDPGWSARAAAAARPSTVSPEAERRS